MQEALRLESENQAALRGMYYYQLTRKKRSDYMLTLENLLLSSGSEIRNLVSIGLMQLTEKKENTMPGTTVSRLFKDQTYITD